MHIPASRGTWDDENVDNSSEKPTSGCTIRSWLQSEQHSDMKKLVRTQFASIYQAHGRALIRHLFIL